MIPKYLHGKYVIVSDGGLALIFGRGPDKFLLIFHTEMDALWFMTRRKRVELGMGIRPLNLARVTEVNLSKISESLRLTKAKLRLVHGPKILLTEKEIPLELDP